MLSISSPNKSPLNPPINQGIPSQMSKPLNIRIVKY